MSRKLTLVAAATLVSLLLPAVPAVHAATPVPQTRYFFHQDGAVEPVTAGTFDTTAPSGAQAAFAPGSQGLGLTPNPAWTGSVGGEIDTLGVDFWQKAPIDELLLHEVNYEVTLTVGSSVYAFPTFTASTSSDVPSEVTHVFTTDDAGTPLPIDATSGPVTIQIAGHYTDAEAFTVIAYDSSQFPSGFSVNVPPPPPPGISPITKQAGGAQFTAPATLPGSNDFGEPSIAIAPPGTKGTAGQPQTLWVSSPRSLSASLTSNTASPVWRSDDGGASWVGPITTANFGPLETGIGGGDTDIETDAQGNVYMIDLWLGNDAVSISQDKGQTWFGSPVSHQHQGDDRAWLAYSAEQNSLYMDYDGLSGVYLDKADLNLPIGPDSALLFQQESIVENNVSRLCVCSPGSLFVDDSRPGAVPYVYALLGAIDGVDLYRSDDGGLTFTHTAIPQSGTQASTSNEFQVGAVDAVGNVYVAWSEVKDGIQDVFYATSTDHGRTWNGPFDASAPIGPTRTALFPAIAADGTGHVGLAFYGTDQTVEPDTAPDSTRWNLYYLESQAGAATPPSFTFTNVVSDFHEGQICTAGVDCGDNDRSLLDFFSVAFDADHAANIVYTTGGQTAGTDLAFVKQTGGAALMPTSLAYSGDIAVQSGFDATYVARLTDGNGQPIADAPITFRLGNLDPVSASTDATGRARATQRVSLDPGPYVLRASFAGDQTRDASATAQPFAVTSQSSFGGVSVVKVAPQNGGGEPSIATGPEGNLYVSYPGGGMNFFRSTDDGASWVRGATASTQSGDTSVNTDSSGAVYQSNLRGISGTNTLQADVYKSLDQGATWTHGAGFLTSGNSTNNPFFVDRQWVDSYIPPGKATTQARVYMIYHDFGPSQVWVNVSKDGGATFGQPVDVISSPEAQLATFCNSIPGGVKVVQSGPHAGRIYVAWLAADLPSSLATGCNLTQLDTFHTVWVAWSDDEGATWTDHLVFDGGIGADASALFADLTLDDQGNPYVAFADNLVGEWDMYVMASFDGGVTWNGASDGTGVPYQVNADPGTHFFPAIAAGDPGMVDVAFIGTGTQIDTLPYGKPAPGGGAGASWRVFLAQSLDLTTGDPHWRVQAVRPEPIHVGDVCTLGLFCEAGTPLGADRDLLDFIDLVVDRFGLAHVAYTDDANDPGIYVGNQTDGSTAIAPSIAFTGATPSSGATTTDVAVGARTVGLPAGTEVDFTLGSLTASALTDRTGTARATLTLSLAPGSYTLRADAAGVSASMPFTVAKDGTNLTVKVFRSTGTLLATLSAQGSGQPIAGRTITFSVNGKVVGTAVTNGSGDAVLKKKPSPGSTVTASFAGDASFLPSQASAIA